MLEGKRRQEEDRRHERIVVLAVAGAFAFTFPVLGLVGGLGQLLGIPQLVFYLFGAWGVFIALLALALSTAAGTPATDQAEDDDAR